MNKVLISACLLGQKVRYDGKDNHQANDILASWRAKDLIVTICPEMAGGLPTPRPPAEIIGGDGHDVLAGKAVVKTNGGEDTTAAFTTGAALTLQLAQKHNVTVAVLKARSPSCGNEKIYTGKFDKTLKKGQGVTAALLEEHGIKVFNETQFEQAEAYRSYREERQD